ncbi:MAG TPA: TolC family protein [Firmicutes bacterium]|jgi:outer membrane protein TolC|nr:TolC family protein [Bacillota bacterium]
MNKKLKPLFVFCFLLLTVLLVRPGKILQAAEAGSLEEAVAWGLAHSPTVLTLEEEIAQLHRQLAKIETNLHWQIGLGAGLSSGGGGGAIGAAPGGTGNGLATAELTGQKLFRSGLSLEPKLSLKKDLSKDDDPELGFTFSINQQLYPWVPSAAEQEYYKTLNALKKAEANLTWRVNSLKIDWLEGYLKLLRLREQLEVAETQYALAVDELALTQKRQEISEASPGQVLAARISLKQAEYERRQVNNRFLEAKREWLLALGLPTTYEIKFEEDNQYYHKLREEVHNLSVTTEDPALLYTKLEATHYQLAAKEIDREQLEQVWTWNEASYLPKVAAGGTYNGSNDKWSLNLNLSYRLWDGGAKRLAREEHEAKLAALERELQNLRANLETELYTRLNAQELAELKLEETSLALEKARLERELYREQWEAGFLSEKDWTLKELAWKNAEISSKSAQDQVFLNKLRVLQLIGLI